MFNGPMKTCTKCGQTKSLDEFHIDRGIKSQRKPACRLCTNKTKSKWRISNTDKVRKQRKESYERNRETYLAYFRSSRRRRLWFAWKLMRKFGITVEQYEHMLESQEFCCAICKKSPSEVSAHFHKHRLHVDHDHKTGLVRGLLCNNCNVALGCLGDSVKRLKRAIQYLRKSQSGDVQ